MTFVAYPRSSRADRTCGMGPDPLTLARLMSLAGLIGGTIEYAEILRRRIARRARDAERAEFEEHGFHGLVRILLVGGPERTERWGERSTQVPS